MRCPACTGCTLEKLSQAGVSKNRNFLPNEPVFHSTLTSLRMSAEQGCGSCNFFFSALRKADDFEGMEENLLVFLCFADEFAISQYMSELLQLHIVAPGDSIDKAKATVSWEVCTRSGVTQHFRDPNVELLGRTIAPNFLHRDNPQLAHQWLSTCQEKHPACATDVEAPRPTRLLHVGSQAKPVVRLVYSNKLPNGTPYVALSHCWGSTTAFKTLGDNLQAHMQSISFQELPRNFQDAIRVTRAMRFEYVWIDSICILQDSVDDWTREAAMMCSVYQNASLTIAADAATNSSEGFLHTRSHANDIILFFPGEQGLTTENMYLRSPLRQFDTLEDEPLNNRGWTCQERILSPRILHFTKEQVFYECRGVVWGEFSGGSLRNPMVGYNKRYHDKLSAKILASIPNKYGAEPNKKHRPEEWYMSIEAFSPRFLTYASDKFPAIGGLARNFDHSSSATGGNYLAGMWENDFPRCMIWKSGELHLDSAGNVRNISHVGMGMHHRSTGILVLKRADEYRAPSWSWASCDGPIKFPYVAGLSDAPDADDLEEEDPRDRDHYERSQLFNLSLLHINLTLRTKSDPFGALDKGSNVVVSGVFQKFLYTPSQPVQFHGRARFMDLAFDIADDSYSEGDYICLQVLRGLWDRETELEEVYCLILEKLCSDGVEGWKRMGTMDIQIPGREKELDDGWERSIIVLI